MYYFMKSRLFFICVLIIPLLYSQSQPQSSPSRLSDKDLFKQAQLDADPKVNRLDNAREALLVIVKRAEDRRKTPDKKYTELLNSLNKRIGEREAAVGEAACGRMDLAACQKQLAVAKSYDPSAATALESTFQAALTKLKQDFQSAIALAEKLDPESSLTQLGNLSKYEEFLPGLKGEIERVRGLYWKKLNEEGRIFIGKRSWDDAEVRFKRVLDMAPGNEAAKTGLDTVDRGRKGYSLASQAEEQLKAGRHVEALETLKAANSAYPEAKSEFEQLQKRITQSWVDHLLASMPELIAGGEADFQKSLEAYLRLQKLMELDPANPEAQKYSEDANRNYTANATQRAQALADISDLSKIATATVLKFNVRRLMPDLIPLEDLKDAMGKFNRKRVSQLVLSVENVGSGATQEFTQNIHARANSNIDRQSLKDLRLRSKEDYEKDPKDDVQFQSLRPDGKSYAALLTISITKCDWQRKSVDRSGEMKSTYIDGTTQEPNPAYEAQSKRVDEIARALNDPARRKGRPTKEGYTEALWQDEKEKLSRIPQFLVKDKIVEYSYQRIEYTQNTDIEVEIMLRDYGSRQEIDRQTISYSHVDKGVEISGIKDRDQNQLLNQALRLPDKAQALEEGLRHVRENLDKILPRLLHSYTDRFFNEGEKALRSGNIENAVESFLCHWAFYGGKLAPEPMKKAASVVREATGFDLEKHGGDLMAELLKVLQ